MELDKFKKAKIYLVPSGEDKDENYFWYQYQSLQDAVDEHHGQEVYIATPKLLGRFVMKTKVVKLKKRKVKK